MDAIEAIMTRRSVRQYTDQPVSEADVKTMLEAAMSAPSANNRQPWAFVVVDERRILDQIPDIHPYSRMLKQAPLAILVCGLPGREKHPGYWVQDCSAATQNLLLAARALGLGAVWLGVHPREDRVRGIRELLSIPDEVVPLALLSIGHPAVEQERAGRYDQARVHHNGW